MKVINENKRLLFTLKEKTSGPLVVAPEELTLVEESLKQTPTPVDSRPYKVYTALLTQTGTDAPVATVLENTLGGDIVWSYYAEGVYNGELLGAFTINKTDISFGAYKSSGQSGDKIDIYDDEGESEDSIKITQLTYDISAIDGFTNIRIEIRVYS